MISSRRTYGLLLVSGAIAAVLFLFNPGLSIALLLLFDLIVLGLAFWDSSQVKPYRVKVDRQVASRLSIGRDNLVTLGVESGEKPVEVRIYDPYPIEFAVSSMPLAIKLGANLNQQLSYTVNPSYRGEYHWKDIQVQQLSPWRLAWHRWKIPQEQKVSVYPDLIGLRSLSIRLTLESSGSIRRARRLGIGTEFSELREYGIGDDPRFIDWKATARRGQPLVRVLEPEQEQTLIILLDRGRLMTSQVKGLSRFDWGLNATLALALAGLHRGDRVGVGVFDRQVQTWIPPERGQAHLNHLIERLTPIQPEILEPDYLGAVTTLVNQQARRALVVVITDIVDMTASSELLAALGRLTPRYLPFCVTLRDPQVDQQAHTVTEDLPSTYERAVALDLIAQRQLAFSTLKQRGVLVLDAPANQITEELIDRYLQLKARNQL
ncbi:DUF58 domain-containing protein [Leptolyngbya sp. NIES-2104]|uniref:DUF58 domain-containing protein n=1 Tax=Leptolyngbya sp. NIES-2104 TaxID=1552121 RepID=UPI0006ECA586|nr:DUF58 domain-containing protein [Leptolyngbya sp. NIES-2104]GAP99259.1 cell division protein DivIC (FtsB) [Leptolyngbya sp. NIES-2104]